MVDICNPVCILEKEYLGHFIRKTHFVKFDFDHLVHIRTPTLGDVGRAATPSALIHGSRRGQELS